VEDLVRLQPVDAAALQEDLALVDVVDPGDAVEEGRLAGAVGADEPVDAPRFEGQRHAVDRGDAAESLDRGADLQDRGHD